VISSSFVRYGTMTHITHDAPPNTPNTHAI